MGAKASVWRVRSDHDPEVPWGLLVRRADLVGDPPPVRIDDVTVRFRRYLLDVADPDELACYLAGTAESMLTDYCCEAATAPQEMHERVRTAATPLPLKGRKRRGRRCSVMTRFFG